MAAPADVPALRSPAESAAELFSAPRPVCTRLLLSAVPSPDPDVAMNFNIGEELARRDATP